MKHKAVFLAGALLSLGIFVTPVLARKWQSKDGKFSVEADLIEATETEVRLLKDDGKEIRVAIEKLSAADVAFLKNQAKPAAGAGSKPTAGAGRKAAAGTGAKLSPIKFKIFDDEYTIDAPAGAKVEKRGDFPVIRQGKTFVMSIQPNNENDLPGFKKQFTTQPEVITLKKTLLEEDDALAYKVMVNAFKEEATVYMVVVDAGDKKFTCSDSSFEEINRKEKVNAKDLQVMIQSAKTLKKAE
jgi:hypothetical protein